MREPLFREEPHSDSGRHATGSLSPRRVPLRARARSVVWNAILRLPHGARTNPLFDADWYLRRYPDVPTRRSGAYRHYSRHGLSEGRDPNEFFRAAWYLKRNPDVAAMGIDPLDHYYLYGADEGRDPGPDFETNWYLSRYPDVALSGVNPLEHYLRRGRHEGRQPSRNGHR